MQANEIQQLRSQAENAVADMEDGALKTKAFEVILNHLLGSSGAEPSSSSRRSSARPKPRSVDDRLTNPRSCTDRVLALKSEGFFLSQRSIGDVREELARHGWHYPVTTLSGKLQFAVRRRELRRIKAGDGKWKYSEP